MIRRVRWLVSVKPLTVKILSKLTVMETEKDYSITCETTGSHPRARITWIEGNETFQNGKVDNKRFGATMLHFARRAPRAFIFRPNNAMHPSPLSIFVNR